jgi:hypothetical protein
VLSTLFHRARALCDQDSLHAELLRSADSQGPQPALEGCPARRKARFSRFSALRWVDIQPHQQGAVSARHQVCGPPSVGQGRRGTEDVGRSGLHWTTWPFDRRQVEGTPATYPPRTSVQVSRGGAQYPLGAPHHTLSHSTKSGYMDPIITQWRSTVSTWGTTPHPLTLHQTRVHGSHHQGVVEHSIHLGHRIQLHHTAILSTKPGCMDPIIREAIEIELHPNSMNRDHGVCLSKSGKFLRLLPKRS